MPQAYLVAFITRGAGAFAYSYAGDPGLEPGQIVAVPFQHRLELGLIVGPDDQPPPRKLLPLIPVAVQRWPRLGGLLLKLCELSVSAPDEIAGYLMFDSAGKSLRLDLQLDPEQLEDQLRIVLAPLAGRLKPLQRKQLVKHWAAVAQLHGSGALKLQASVAGDPESTRGIAEWRRSYRLPAAEAALLALPAQDLDAPGSYLGGFDGLALRSLARGEAAERALPAEPGTLRFPATQVLNPDWELPQLWPELAQIELHSSRSSWSELRSDRGLLAELTSALAASQRVLVLTPQAWVVERLWPCLYPLAAHLSRFRAEAGPGVASEILRRLDSGPHAVLGGPGAWKLAAYCAFDRVIVVDPTHPQYSAERTPHLDPRLALLICAAQCPGCVVDYISFGLDALDGSAARVQLQLDEPYEPPDLPLGGPGAPASEDTDPLPLELRRGDLRRLVFYNRLGSGRGLYCAECWSAVPCPHCGGTGIHYSPRHSAYVCPACGLKERDLRCPRCHLMTLVSVLPGLESVTRRSGDLVLHGPVQERPSSHTLSVIGTSQLLDPLPGFWPEQIIYVHAEGRLGLMADWPAAVDAALRLAALYDNPDLRDVHIVSTRLREQLGPQPAADSLPSQYRTELELRDLTGLPPYGTLFHLRLTSAQADSITAARQLLGEHLHELQGTLLLRLGKAYRQGGAHRLAGWLVNPQLRLREVQELRWRVHKLDATLTVHALRGPWVW